MCGINGYIDKTGNKDLNVLINQMNKSIFHRGPDDSGVWVNDKLGMGMQRLSIIDLKLGSQPMHNPSNESTIVFNGEIYNYLILKGKLEKKGYGFNTNSDTEVILKLYQEFGVDSFRMLDGMFAFSIYDSITNKIYCVRDFFGEKPLYYFSNNKSIAWSSELKSLCPLFENKPSIDSEALSLYFRLTYIPAPFTIYDGVYNSGAMCLVTEE